MYGEVKIVGRAVQLSLEEWVGQAVECTRVPPANELDLAYERESPQPTSDELALVYD